MNLKFFKKFKTEKLLDSRTDGNSKYLLMIFLVVFQFTQTLII